MILNEQQSQIIESNHKRILVAASAGSGKTTVLIEKTNKLLKNGISPNAILVLTFTTKAAMNFKKRVIAKNNDFGKYVEVKTFHSFCRRLLYDYSDCIGINRDFRIIDENDRIRFIATVANKIKASSSTRELFKEKLGSFKNGILPVPRFLTDFYNAYENKLRQMNALELDDLIPLTLKLLKQESNIQSMLQDRIKYLLVDEYQDINQQQQDLLDLLICDDNNIIVVGDDDQAIYEWRGSKPNLIVDYSKDPNVKVFHLERNYRSQQNIIVLANKIIKRNQNRIFKTMISNKKPIEKPVFETYINQTSEAKGIIEKIMALHRKSGIIYNDVAILLRNNSQSIVIIEELKKKNVPYYFYGDNTNLDKSILNFLKYFSKLKEAQKFYLNVINFPTNIIDKIDYEELCKQLNLDPKDYKLSLNIISQSGLLKDNSKILTNRLNYFIHYETSEYQNIYEIITDFINTYQNNDELFSERNREQFELMISYARSFSESNQESDFYDFIIDTEIRNYEDSMQMNNEGIQIMTIHRAKGLEFEIVFIPGVQSGLFPNEFFIHGPKDIEAERRLLYVALTRAKTQIYMSRWDISENRTFDTEIISDLSSNDDYEEQENTVESVISSQSNLDINYSLNILSSSQKKMIDAVVKHYNAFDVAPYFSSQIKQAVQYCIESCEYLEQDSVAIDSAISGLRFVMGNTLKVTFDEILNHKSSKLAEYLKNDNLYGALERLNFIKRIKETKRIKKAYSDVDLENLVKLKSYLDALQHQSELSRKKNTKMQLNDFRSQNKIQKLEIILSIIKFYYVLIPMEKQMILNIEKRYQI